MMCITDMKQKNKVKKIQRGRMIWQVSHESSRGRAGARPGAPGRRSGDVETYLGPANTILHALG